MTKCVIDELNQSQFRSIIATGDNIFTAISVAKKCNILLNKHKVIYAHTIEYNENYEECIQWELEQEKPSTTIHHTVSNKPLKMLFGSSRNLLKNGSQPHDEE